jgi:hypothetical protein
VKRHTTLFLQIPGNGFYDKKNLLITCFHYLCAFSDVCYALAGVPPSQAVVRSCDQQQKPSQIQNLHFKIFPDLNFVFSFMPLNFEHHTQFFTSTILDWKYLLKDDAYKQIIIDSLLFLKKKGVL